MRKTLFSVAVLMLAASSANAQQTVKVGLIMAYSGQFADTAAQMDNAIKLYVKQHGDTVAGKKIEFIRKDTGGPNPDVAKRLAQELVVRDQVDVLAGFTLTPEALGAGDVSAEAKKLMVVMNAATSVITTKSPYIARTSLTIPQLENTFGQWAYKNGLRKIYTMVSDYGPGIDAETWFTRGFKDAGGEIVGSVRMPVASPDFSAFVQRAKDLDPEAIFIFIPGGTQPAAMTKAMQERGLNRVALASGCCSSGWRNPQSIGRPKESVFGSASEYRSARDFPGPGSDGAGVWQPDRQLPALFPGRQPNRSGSPAGKRKPGIKR